MESYGYDIYTRDFNEKVFRVTKEDKQMDSIAKDFKNYFQICSEYGEYLNELIKKYNIKQSGNIVKRIAFNLKKDNNMPMHNYKYLPTAIDPQSFS